MKKLSLFVFFWLSVWATFAQVSDEQVVNMLKNARSQGMSQQEIVVMLTKRGVTQEQLLRIRAKYGKNFKEGAEVSEKASRMREEQKPTAAAPGENAGVQGDGTLLDSLGAATAARAVNRQQGGFQVFGREIFNNRMLTFEPNLNIATPETYILGPGDEVIVDIWGDARQTLSQRIAPDGTITDVQLGPIVLNGLSVAEANARLKNAYGSIYSTMNGSEPTTFMKMSLGEIRSIQINVMGEVVMPGTYTLPSLASLFHAIYSAGGVNGIGSLRGVKVVREGKELAKVDIYDYLLKGRSNIDIQLKDGDVVIVSPYQNLISLKGKVKRPMYYEMENGETLLTLLDFAGGFTGDAYKKAVQVIRRNGFEYQVYNVEEPEYASFRLMDGDEISVSAMLNRFENKIEIRGAVYRPGLYALNETTATVKQLVEKAAGVEPDAFLNRAVLYRERPNLTLEVVAIDMEALLAGTAPDVQLRKNDVLYIPSIFDLKEEYTVSINGAVGVPGTYPFAKEMTIEDLIVQAGGLKEAASEVRIDIARRIKNPKSSDFTDTLAENFTLSLKEGLKVDGAKDFVLKPFDEVFIRTSPGYQRQQGVSISGEVLFGGTYVLSKRNERLSDLIKRAGGLEPTAYVKGARLTRRLNADERARVQAMLKLSQQRNRDSLDVNRIDIGDTYYVGIELSKAIANPGSEYDLVLREGDVLHIPQYNGTVRISGAVMYPNTVVYKQGANLKHYVDQAGGFAFRAKKKKAFIVYMNGTVASAKGLSRAKAAPGCEVIVPVKPPRKGWSLGEFMSLATTTTSMAALVTSIVNSTK